MRIIGTKDELVWIKEALANNCTECIFTEQCEQNAEREQKEQGKIKSSCKDFLEKQIIFVQTDDGAGEKRK